MKNNDMRSAVYMVFLFAIAAPMICILIITLIHNLWTES